LTILIMIKMLIHQVVYTSGLYPKKVLIKITKICIETPVL